MSRDFERRFETEVMNTIRDNPYSTKTQIRQTINWDPVDHVLLDRALKKLVRDGAVTQRPGNFMQASGPVFHTA